MKSALLLLLFISIGFAQFEELDESIADCQWSCCATYDGSWDNQMQLCSFEGNDEVEYYECSNACLENKGAEISGHGSGSLCTPPAILIFILISRL